MLSWVAGASEEGPVGPRRSELIIIFLISQDPWGPCLECENRRHVVSLLIKFHLSLNSRSATRILSNQEALYYNYFLVYSDTSSTLVKDCINSFVSWPQKRGAHNRSSANQSFNRTQDHFLPPLLLFLDLPFYFDFELDLHVLTETIIGSEHPDD